MYPNRKTARTGCLFIRYTRRKNSKQTSGSYRTTSVEFIYSHRKKEGEPLKVGIQRFDPSIPVVIDYYTLYPKPDGGWEESPDPYGYDEILLKKLEAF